VCKLAEYLEPKVLYAGDSAVTIEFGDSIDIKVNARVQQLRQFIDRGQFNGVVELVPPIAP